MTKTRMYYLKYFCLQYEEKKKKLDEYTYYKSPTFGNDFGSTKGTFKGGFEDKVVKKMALENDLNIIEKTVEDIGGELAPFLFENVTKGTPYEYLDPPASRRSFFYIKNSFFKELDNIIN